MIIKYKKNSIYFDEFKLKCCIGKAGIRKNRVEGDKTTPIGTFKLGDLYYRKDRNYKIVTNFKKIAIKNTMGWCNDSSSIYYNRLINIQKLKKISYEKLYRNDYKYDFLIPIHFNYYKTKKYKGSAIFIHLTKNYKGTSGCIGLKKKDFLVLLKIVTKNSKIIIKD